MRFFYFFFLRGGGYLHPVVWPGLSYLCVFDVYVNIPSSGSVGCADISLVLWGKVPESGLSLIRNRRNYSCLASGIRHRYDIYLCVKNLDDTWLGDKFPRGQMPSLKTMPRYLLCHQTSKFRLESIRELPWGQNSCQNMPLPSILLFSLILSEHYSFLSDIRGIATR